MKPRRTTLLFQSKILAFSLLNSCVLTAVALDPAAPATGSWNLTSANGNWSEAIRWQGSIPNGVDHIAELINNITANRTVTIDSGIPGSNVTLGGMRLGDLSGGNSFTISGGTLTLQASEGNAFITKQGKGGNDTISSALQLNSAVDFLIADTNGNSLGLTLAGKISGGTVGSATMNLAAIDGENFVRHLLLNNNTNDFAGQIVVNSGLLRLEGGARGTSNTFGSRVAGLRGVGNEVWIKNGGRVDLRDSDFDVQADDTEIFIIEGSGMNGLGAMVNTASTASLSHLALSGDASVGGYSNIELKRYLNAAGTSEIGAVLDLSGHDLTKIGSATMVIENADIRNATGSAFNIHEGSVMFRNKGGLVGGGLIGGTTYGNQIDGLTFNVAYYDGAFDGLDLTQGSRTSDPFNPNRLASDLSGNTVIAARLVFRTDWGTGTTHVPNQKVVETYDNLTINLNNGSLVREGNGETGRTFDHIFGPGTVVNLVGGGLEGNILTMGGGATGYNSATDRYDHPGVTEIQGQIDNTTADNEGTGFTKRGNRELRLTGNNVNFNGDVLVKQNTGRVLPSQYTNTSPTGAAESQFFSLSLAGAQGSLNQANSITLSRWGSLALLNNSQNGVYASTNNNDRLNDQGTLSLRNGFLTLETDVAGTNTENFGNVAVNAGTNYLYLDTRAGGQFDGSFNSLTRSQGGILKIYNLNGSHTWGTGAADDRLKLNNTTGINLIGQSAPGSAGQQVIPGLFGGSLPASFAASIGAAANRTAYTVQNAYAYGGSGIGLMTLENGYLRPLTANEYSVGGSPVAGTNWLLDRYLGSENALGRSNYANRNVTQDVAVNSLTLAFNSTTSGQAVPVAARDYLIIEPGRTLTINSGIINFASFIESDNSNPEAMIRGGTINMNGQAAIINSALSRHDLDANSGSFGTFMPGSNAFMRSNIVNATDLVKTGRNNLYLDTWNQVSGNIYISEQGGLLVRHSGALGAGAPGREVVVGGAGNFYLEYGTNITGLNLRVSNTFDTSRTVLRNEGTTHSTWGGDVIFDIADEAGSGEFQSHVITARNNGTLSIYGNIYTANNQNQSDNDSWNDPTILSTSIGEGATINFRGQFRDLESGSLSNVGATGDNATRLDRNHSLVFQMRGHDEMNVNAFQQWDATGSIFATQGYFRIQYDPSAAGLDGTGFQTQDARLAITQDNQWNQMWLGSPQNFLGVSNIATNVYHGHVLLTKADQVLNYADRINISNNNRNHTLTLGGEHMSGNAYIGSADNSLPYRILFQNANTERDLRFLQVRGGTLVVNARLEDSNTTADSFNATVSLVGPGTVIFNRNAVGNSNVDRWNFMAGTAVWAGMNGDNQFARTRTTGTNALAAISTWGGGNLVLEQPAGTTMRTQSLDGDIYLLNGASSATTNTNTTLTLGAATRLLRRDSGSSLAFLENGNGVINFSATGLSTTAGAFLGSWAVYGNSVSGVTDWAARQGTTGVQGFTAYSNDAFGAALHTNLTGSAVLTGNTESQTLRFGAAAQLDIGAGNTLTLNQGGLLIPSSVTGDVSLSGGSITSSWSQGSGDLMLHHHGQGTLTVGSVISNDGANKVNLVHAGNGTTVLTEDNTLTGNVYLNNGVLKISRDSQLGQVNGSIAQVVLVNAGSSYTNSQNNAVASLLGGNGTGASVTFNTGTGVVSAINVVNGGSGYTEGVRVTLDGTAAGNNAGAWAILDSGNLYFDGGVLHVTESLALNSGRTLFLGGNGGTLRVDPSKTLIVDGFISGKYNHADTDYGYTLSDSLGSPWEASSVRNPDIGDLTIDGGGTVVFRYAPLGDGSTPANMGHVYGGITWINDGVLSLQGVGSTGVTGALGTHRSFLDSTVIGNNGSLDLFFSSSDPSILEWMTLRGSGFEGGGTIRSIITGATRSYNLTGQIHIEEDAIFKIFNSHNIYINNGGGDLFGQGDLTRIGNGDFRFYGNNPEWKGAFLSASGTTRLIGAGSLGGLSRMELDRNSIFYLSTASTTINEFGDRLPDDLAITSDGYIRLRMDATGGVHSGFEKAGVITAEAGVLGLEYNLGADYVTTAGVTSNRLQGDYAGWHFTEIVRQPGASVHLRNFDSGTSFAGRDFTSGNVTNKAVLQVDVAPLVVGSGNGLNGNAPIVPGFFGGTRDLLVASSDGVTQRFDEAYTSFRLVTLDSDGSGNHFLRPLELSEYKTVASPDGAVTTTISLDEQGLTSDQNLRIVGRDSDSLESGQLGSTRQNSLLTLNASKTVNSLSFNSETYVQNGAANPSSAATQGGDHTTLQMRDDTKLTVASGMIQAANFGVLDRMGITNSGNSNLDIRSQINGGELDFAGREAHIYVGGFFTRYDTAGQPKGYEGIDGDNTTLTIASGITNSNGLVKTGPGALILTGFNTYSGDTHINHGSLYARSDFALGQSENVNVAGSGNFYLSHGASVHGADIRVGNISGNNIALAIEQGGTWGGNIILDNVDNAGATGYTRNFIPRVLVNSTNIGTVRGDIYGGAGLLAAGVQATESRIFTTYTGAAGILDLRGQIRDNASGPVNSLVTADNQNQVLRMEVIATTNEANVQLWQPYDSAGQIILKRGYLRYSGEGQFYTAAAAAALNPDNAMSGFHIGGRGLIASGTADGLTTSNATFVLANEGSSFNLASFTVGGDITDPNNVFGHGNWGLGNTTGNTTIGGENRSGEVVFGTGTGTIRFTPYTTLADRDLRLYAAPGGEVTIRANFVDGGTTANPVNTSITKIGAGQVNLQGSSAGSSTVEGVNILGGVLLLEGYDANPSRRVGLNANLLMAGGTLAVDGGQENFGSLRVNAGGSALAAIGAAQVDIASLGTRSNGGTLHFQSIAGGTLRLGGVASGTRLGSYATFGSAADDAPLASSWASVNGAGQVVAFTDYADNAFGAGLHTDLTGPSMAGGVTESIRFNTSGAAVTSGSLTVNDGGLLFTNSYSGGTAIAAGVNVTSSAGRDLIWHNYASAPVTVAGNITGGQNVVFTGVGETILTGTNTYTGVTYVTGASTLAMDGISRLGTGALQLNGGTVKVTGTGTDTYATNITLGSGDGTLNVENEDKILVLRGIISSENNPVASLSGNPNSGGLRIEGSGTVQFGSRTDGASLVGVANTYTGLTILGDGINSLRVDLQGGGANNTQHTPFGSTDSWTDGTIVKNNVTLEFSPQEGGAAGTDQVRYREWMQFGEQAGDQIYLAHTTRRQVVLDGFYNVVGDLNIHTQNALLPGSSTGNREVYINPNEGGLVGSGNIVKTGAGSLYFYNSLTEWTGDLDIREGLTLQLMYPGASLEGTGNILLGDPSGVSTTALQYRVQSRYGNSDTAVDSGRQTYLIPRDIQVRDNIKQEIRIGGSYASESTLEFTGDIYLGAGSTGGGGALSSNHVRFYYEDSTAYNAALVGHQQHVLMNFRGNLSGSNNLMLENSEDGSANNDPYDQFVTYFLGGDNSGFTGKVTIGGEQGVGTNNFDRDDNEILRMGSATALTSSNIVEMRNLSTLQVGGQGVTIGGLISNDGVSTSGLYSFTSPTWDPTRQTTADLAAINANVDAASGTLHGATGTANFTPVGNSSAIVENASVTPGTLRIVQNGNTSWDVYFRDGVPSAQYENSAATPGSLSLDKQGTGAATLTIFNDYTGTTTVSAGALQVGQGGTGQWDFVSQGGTAVFTATTDTIGRVAGSTGTGMTTVMAGATLSGSGHVRGDLTMNGRLSPGDAILDVVGAARGTLFIGNGNGGNMVFNPGAILSMQLMAPSLVDAELSAGNFMIGGFEYEDYISVLPLFNPSSNAFPDYFGQPGAGISSVAHDHLEIGGDLTWNGGRIEISSTVTGFSPQAGHVYNLLDWFGVSDWGSFNSGSSRYLVGNGDDNGDLDLPDLSAYPELRWDTGLFNSHGVLVISTMILVPEPGRAMLIFIGFMWMAFRRRR